MNHAICTRRRHSSWGAFTLVELLVVIGIIAVLIGVLLPALNRARKQADAVKCASQLREIGNAYNLYAAEYKGYWPVARHQANATLPPPPNQQYQSAIPRNDYWYMFLLKYFTKKQYNNTTGLRLTEFQNTPLWGCPSVDRENFDASTSSAEFNSGYGVNFLPGYKRGQIANLNSSSSRAAYIDGVTPGALVGRYWKVTQWTQAPDRLLVADSRSWFLEATSFNNPLDPLGAPAFGDEPKGVGYLGSYNNQFNRYRHGDRKTKKQAFNVLFCDGHVATLQDVKEGIKAIRFRYPN